MCKQRLLIGWLRLAPQRNRQNEEQQKKIILIHLLNLKPPGDLLLSLNRSAWLRYFELKIKNHRSTQHMKYINGLICIILLWSCGHTDHDQRSTFRYNEQTGNATLDPAFAKNQSIIWAVHQIYNSLVETDKDLNIVPSLARSWEISSDR